MVRFVALLRGVNVGGKSRVVMSDLRQELTRRGCAEVITYINSGNILFSSDVKSASELATMVSDAVESTSGITCDVVVMTSRQLQEVASHVPLWWGEDPDWKHNLLFVIPPTTVDDVIQAIGVLKTQIERIAVGRGVIYQSMSFDQFGKTTTGKLASSAIYKRLTIRNRNTVLKLAELARTD